MIQNLEPSALNRQLRDDEDFKCKCCHSVESLICSSLVLLLSCNVLIGDFYQKLIPLMPFIVFLLYFYLLLGSKCISIYLFPFPARQSSCDVLLGKFVRKYFLDLCRPRPFFAFNLYYCPNIDSLRKAIRWFQELFLNAFFLC